MGFDELLLEEMQYPVNGKLHKIDFSQNTMEKAEALALFLSELRSALEPYGVSISLLLDEAVIRGLAEDTEDSGLVAQQILPLVDAVYVSTEDIQTARQEMNTILDGKNMPVLVSIVGEATAEAGWYLIG